jgi:pimeloyl-ACP methyl ester carboxylesterase
MADTAADVAAIADELGVDRFAVWGTSGGGPHALACVALLTDRVVAAAVVASYAPYDAAGLDFFAGMSEGGTQLLKLTTAGRDALHQVLSQAAEAVRLGTPEQWIEQMSPMVSPPDRALFDAKLAAAILADWREGLRPGVEGWVDDYLALLAPWGIDLGSVRAPVRGPRSVILPSVALRLLSDERCSSTHRGIRAASAAPSPAPGRAP